MAVFDDLHEYGSALRVQRLHAEVVDDEQMLLLHLDELCEVRPVGLGHLKAREELGAVLVEYAVAIGTSLMPQCRGDVALAGSGTPCNEDVLVSGDEAAVFHAEDLIAVHLSCTA